jgi:hypothetical protein
VAVSGLESSWLPIWCSPDLRLDTEPPAGFAISLPAGQATKYGQQIKAIDQVNTHSGGLTSNSGTDWLRASQGPFSAMPRST